jgi:hypothetical protein
VADGDLPADWGPCQAGRVVLMRDNDGTWPTPDNPCPEPAERFFSMVTPGPGRYMFHAELCALHEIEFVSHFHLHQEKPPWEDQE